MYRRIRDYAKDIALELTYNQKIELLSSQWFLANSEYYIPEELKNITDRKELTEALVKKFVSDNFAEIISDFMVNILSSESQFEFGFDITSIIVG